MKRHADIRSVTIASLAAAGSLAAISLLGGCRSAETTTADRRGVEGQEAVLYRTAPVLLEPETSEPVRLTIAAGDRLGLQVRDVYLARAEGTLPPNAEPVLVAQTER